MVPGDSPSSTPAPASDPELVFERVFDVPRELVFEAWSEPRHLAEWCGPNGLSTTTRPFDSRPAACGDSLCMDRTA